MSSASDMRMFVRDTLEGVWRRWLLLAGCRCVRPLLGMLVPLIERSLIDDGLVPGQYSLVVHLVILYIGVELSISLLTATADWLEVWVAESTALAWQCRLRGAMFSGSDTMRSRWDSGKITALSLNDIPYLQNMGARIATVPGLVVSVIVSIVVAVRLVGGLAIVLVPLILCFTVATWLAGGLLRRFKRRTLDTASDCISALQEDVAGVQEIASYGQRDLRDRKYRRRYAEYINSRLRESVGTSIFLHGADVLPCMALGVAMLIGAKLIAAEAITLGALLAFRHVLLGAIYPIQQVAGVYSSIQAARAAYDRLNVFMDDMIPTNSSLGVQASCVPKKLIGHVRAVGVSFSYEPECMALDHLSLEAKPGQLTVIVGPNGSGKSTLLHLLRGGLTATDGGIFIDDRPIEELDRDCYWSHLGVMYQQPVLFEGTVADNIAFGKKGASSQEIAVAAHQAWVKRRNDPLGLQLDREVGVSGAHLSVGQRQRIALARVFIRNPRIVMLDEPFSAIDSGTADILERALVELARTRTVLVVTHRRSLLEIADVVYMLSGGKCIGVGTHNQLLDHCEDYLMLFGDYLGPSAGKLANDSRR